MLNVLCKFVKGMKIKEVPLFSPHKLISDTSRHTHQEFKFSVLRFAKLKTVVNFLIAIIFLALTFQQHHKNLHLSTGFDVFNAICWWHWWPNKKV